MGTDERDDKQQQIPFLVMEPLLFSKRKGVKGDFLNGFHKMPRGEMI